MYHKLSATEVDELTVTPAQLEQQLAWVRAQGGVFLRMADVLRAIDGRVMLPRCPVLVTFDDAYLDTFEMARPVLKRLGIPAVVFVPTAFVGRTAAWDGNGRTLMNAAQLRELAADGWELGLHSHNHINYETASPSVLASDLQRCVAFFRRENLPWTPAIAYPYGRRPRGWEHRQQMLAEFRAHEVRLGFRIGNRVNPWPLRDPFEINRLGARGDRTLEAFQRKFRWGRLW